MSDTTVAQQVTPAEVMAVVFAREMPDNGYGGLGAASQIPMAAVRLAQLMHAPNLSWFCGASGVINPPRDATYETSSDYRNMIGAEGRIAMEDVVDWETSGRFDFGFLGGMQIDGDANVNMAVIGAWDSPDVRGPGTVGLVFMAGFRRIYLYTEHHDTRILVERVDFVSGPGVKGRAEGEPLHGSPGTGPEMLVTPLAVFDFDADHGPSLRSYHPWTTPKDVQARTGFKFDASRSVETTLPSEEEFTLLRNVVDPHGVLRALIASP